jgi:prepilin-type N-terminal cleavage/methylation domain-containing protein
MSPLSSRLALLEDERGYTLIELVVAMALGMVLMVAVFTFLQFTTNDVSRITQRAEVDQTGRTALEKIMLALHSACVAPTVAPIRSGSGPNTIRFVSETSPLNTNKEPVSALTTVKLHEITYTPASGKVQGTLVEKSWPSSGLVGSYTFNEKETPTERKLLTGVKRSGAGESTPIFQYYRYYRTGDKEPQLGTINPTATTVLKEEEEAKTITKVTVSFTLSPEGHEYTAFGNDRPVALEDSAIFRLAPSSEASGTSNLPCAQI